MSAAMIGFLLGVCTGGCFGMLVTACLVAGDDSRYENPYKTAYEALCDEYDRRGTLLAEMYPFVVDGCADECKFHDGCSREYADCKAITHYRDELAKVNVEVEQ